MMTNTSILREAARTPAFAPSAFHVCGTIGFILSLATWFGVSATDLPTVLPNIGRFAKPNLGFV